MFLGPILANLTQRNIALASEQIPISLAISWTEGTLHLYRQCEWYFEGIRIPLDSPCSQYNEFLFLRLH